MLKNNKKITKIGTILFGILLASFLLKPPPLRLNLSTSMPRGIYYISADQPTRGSFITLCLPAANVYHSVYPQSHFSGSCPNHTQPLLKQLVGLSGDRIDLDPNQITLNGVALPHSSSFVMQNKRLPNSSIQKIVLVLNEQQIWVYGTKSIRSYDSRYFGPLSMGDIVAVVTPLWLWD